LPLAPCLSPLACFEGIGGEARGERRGARGNTWKTGIVLAKKFRVSGEGEGDVDRGEKLFFVSCLLPRASCPFY